MKFEEYKDHCFETWGHGNETIRTKIGLEEEFGELSGKIKRWFRGDYNGDIEKLKSELIGEVGDCLYYLTMATHYFEKNVDIELKDITHESLPIGFIYEIWETLIQNKAYFSSQKRYSQLIKCLIGFANQCGLKIDDVIDYNLKKLKDRQERGKINGSGDNR